jgi:membrane-associated phospholipid phosphatase
VSRIGLAVMGGLLAVVLVVGALRNGMVQALGDMGFRSPMKATYTLILLSPLAFEAAYPRLTRRWEEGSQLRTYVDRLHIHAPYLIVVGLVMLAVRLENVWDLDITAFFGWDLTPVVHTLEGDAVGTVQHAMRHRLLDLFFWFIYIDVYFLWHAVGLFVFALSGLTGLVKRMTVAWVLIYAIAMPFYILAPINETWVTNPIYDCGYDYAGAPEGIIHQECGFAKGMVYAISSINNCFPSLHNAFAWILPFVLWRSGRTKWANRLAPVAFLISVSTIYLGIHWFTDLVAGLLTAWIAAVIATRIDFTLAPSLAIKGLKWTRRTPA